MLDERLEHIYGMGVIRQVEMTPASREPVSWQSVTRDLNGYRIVSAMAMLRQLGSRTALEKDGRVASCSYWTEMITFARA